MKRLWMMFGILMIIITAGCSLEQGNMDFALENSAQVTSVNRLPEVALLFAKTTGQGGSHSSPSAQLLGYIEIENLAYHKEVIVHYNIQGSPAWTDVSAQYVKTLSSGKELWKFETPTSTYSYPYGALTYNFAVKYSANGTTWWDNNNGENYHTSVGVYQMYPALDLGSMNIRLQTGYAFNISDRNLSVFSGTVVVRDLAYNKNVQIIYSTDNWATIQTLNASYLGLNTGYGARDWNEELWSFQAELPLNTETITFALKYTVGTQTYWDNNFESDYSIQLSDGSNNF